MSQSLTQLYVHIIFSTKHRHDFITDEIKEELYSYISKILKSYNSPPLQIGGTNNHIHILCKLSKNYTLCKIIEEIKKNSSKWMKSKGIVNFFWQGEYGVFSVSQSQLEVVKKYIINQVEHHRTKTFENEFRYLLKKNRIVFDERYVWD